MRKKMKAVIIDDDENAIGALKLNISFLELDVVVVAEALTVEDGIKVLEKHEPDLLFLDVDLPDGTGFDVLKRVKSEPFQVIFTTSYVEHALKAFECAAVHYLVKPIQAESLREAVERSRINLGRDDFSEKLNLLKTSLLEKPERILLPTQEGNLIFNISDITRCEAGGNYTKVFFSDKKPVVVSKSLIQLENILSDLNFARIHSGHLVNLNYVARYNNTHITLQNGEELPISQNKRPLFTEQIRSYARRP